jgi:hypothetical protein
VFQERKTVDTILEGRDRLGIINAECNGLPPLARLDEELQKLKGKLISAGHGINSIVWVSTVIIA